MKLYIATPINARKEAAKKDKLEAAKHRINLLKDLISDDPIFAGYTFLRSTFDVTEPDDKEDEALAACVREVLRCDAIYLDHGWQSSKECNLEYRTAKIYGKKIYDSDKL